MNFVKPVICRRKLCGVYEMLANGWTETLSFGYSIVMIKIFLQTKLRTLQVLQVGQFRKSFHEAILISPPESSVLFPGEIPKEFRA